MFTHYYCGTNIDVRQFWGYCRIILPSINNAFVSQVNRVANFSCNINFIGVFIIENYNFSGSHTTECYTGLHIFRAATAGLRTTTLKIRK